eukprot:TRINITY_DN41661_c0_g1_i2.p1 TRINITY_DN41661_c0_g1~~TRINITY_DN41661_c0_g1_i2.p1  ORF type:complete len:461 (-),score=50.93 TRINITY_DN41661_c0_g1_i2:12-1394(-)
MPNCEVGVVNLCLDSIDDQWWGVVIEDVAGASFMAFGSAAPEIIINAVSTLKVVNSGGGEDSASSGETELGIGAIIGSSMIAFTIIPGSCGLFAKTTLKLPRRPLARDILFYSLALLLLCRAFADSVIVLHEALTFLVTYALYLVVVFAAAKVRRLYQGRAADPSAREVFPHAHPAPRESVVELQANAARESLSPTSAVNKPGKVNSEEQAPAEILPEAAAAAEEASPLHQQLTQRAQDFGLATIRPLQSLLEKTCPECGQDSDTAHLYPITFVSSLVWVAILSTVIAAVVSRWGDLMGVPSSFLGMYVIAMGAEIPDMIQSVTVARRGYGSMAVSNCTGSQILNILVGLGMPWTISCLAGKPVRVPGHAQLQVMAYFQVLNVCIFFCLVLVPSAHTWRCGRRGRAILGKRQGALLVILYLVSITLYMKLQLSKGSTSRWSLSAWRLEFSGIRLQEKPRT